MEKSKNILKDVEYCKNPYEASENTDALIILTEWNEFKELDFKRIKSLMNSPLIIDGRNIYNPDDMVKEGFRYISIGRKEVK